MHTKIIFLKNINKNGILDELPTTSKPKIPKTRSRSCNGEKGKQQRILFSLSPMD